MQFPNDLDIAMDIQIRRRIFVSIKTENKNIPTILVPAEIVECLDHAGQSSPAYEDHGPDII